MARISADTLVLVATNEGGLYQEHKALARYTMATQGVHAHDMWELHIKARVLPYIGETMTLSDRFDAAVSLRRYYEDHIREGA